MNMLPTFIFMGLPNGGKTTMASTLGFDATLDISAVAGNTKENHLSSVKIGKREYLRFIDTPGLQHTDVVHAWFARQEDRETAPVGELPRRFVAEHAHDDTFTHECELMHKLKEKFAVIYVVDPGRPVLKSDRQMMEVLRWCGNARVGLINGRNEQPAALEDWHNKMRRNFTFVREFNGVRATYAQLIALFEGLSKLEARWETQMDAFVVELKSERQRQLEDQAEAIIRLLEDVLRERVSVSSEGRGRASVKREIEETLKRRVYAAEANFQKNTLKRFKLSADSVIDSSQQGLDIFSQEAQETMGLSEGQLVAAATAAGAAIGLLLDAATAGISFGIFAILGGALGGAGAYFKNAFAIKIPGQWRSLFSEKSVALGRIDGGNNCIWILLEKAIRFSSTVAERTHGQREKCDLSNTSISAQLRSWEAEQRKPIAELLGLFSVDKTPPLDKVQPIKTEATAVLMQAITNNRS